jgi:N-acyl-D-aspartate/D-glutamate deacylase
MQMGWQWLLALRMCNASYSTQFLADGVRERGLITLQEAVHQLCDVPARWYGLLGRGRLEPGAFADIVLFDPQTVGLTQISGRHDLPGGNPRFHAGASGIARVLVNGTDVVVAGELTGELPGCVLRSGRDSNTVTAS